MNRSVAFRFLRLFGCSVKTAERPFLFELHRAAEISIVTVQENKTLPQKHPPQIPLVTKNPFLFNCVSCAATKDQKCRNELRQFGTRSRLDPLAADFPEAPIEMAPRLRMQTRPHQCLTSIACGFRICKYSWKHLDSQSDAGHLSMPERNEISAWHSFDVSNGEIGR